MTVVSSIVNHHQEREENAKAQSVDNQRKKCLSTNGMTSNTKAKRKPTSLPQETVEYLKNWMMSPEHIAHPYPTEQEKAQIMKDTGIELKQLTNWFVNNRKRYWKPRVEARLQQQAKGQATPSAGPVSTPVGSPKNPAPVTPSSRRQSLVHVISTPNVTNMNQQHSSDRALGTDGTSYPVVSESSGSSSECESVGMNIDQDDISASPPYEEPHGRKNYEVEMISGSVQPTGHSVSVPGNKIAESIAQSIPDTDNESLSNLNRVTETNSDLLEASYLKVLKERSECAPKRRCSETVDLIAPRPKYRRKSVETWKKACAEADHGYSWSLPTLDEAARLFGFA